MNRPTGRTPPTRPETPAEPSSTTPEWQPLPPEKVVGGGLNGRQALESILGPGQLTEDVPGDCVRAMHTIDEWLHALPLRRKLILHVLHSWQRPNGVDRWQIVADLIGRKKSTAHDWAHPRNLEDQD
jgi:hypothetical protein